MSRSRLCVLALFLVALVAGLSPAFADGSATGCQPPLDFAAANSTPAPKPGTPDLAPEPEFMAGRKLGYCHCGCGVATCRTSADCGGSSCDQFISCC